MKQIACCITLLAALDMTASAQWFKYSVVAGLNERLPTHYCCGWVGNNAVAEVIQGLSIRKSYSLGAFSLRCGQLGSRVLCESKAGIGYRTFLLELRAGSRWIDLYPIEGFSDLPRESVNAALLDHPSELCGRMGCESAYLYTSPSDTVRSRIASGAVTFSTRSDESFHRADIAWLSEEVSSWKDRELTAECEELESSEDDPLGSRDREPPLEVRRQQRALDICGALTTKYPANPRLWFFYGRALKASGRTQEARSAFQKAAGHSYPAAFLELALLDDKTNTPEAVFELTLRASDEGVPTASALVGIYYRLGRGVAENKTIALRYYQTSARAGNIVGQLMLGTAHYFGEGTTRDPEKAAQIFAPLSDTSVYGAYMMGLIEAYHRRNMREAIRHFSLAAENGFADAQWQLGAYFYFDEHLMEPAHTWLDRSAAGGNPLAQYLVGLQFLDGEGTLRDVSKAVIWFGRASEQGLELSNLTLGDLYYSGVDVTRDLGRARTYYQKAASSQDERIRSAALRGLTEIDNPRGHAASLRRDSGGSAVAGVAVLILSAWALSNLASSTADSKPQKDEVRRREEQRRQQEDELRWKRDMKCAGLAGIYNPNNGLCENTRAGSVW